MEVRRYGLQHPDNCLFHINNSAYVGGVEISIDGSLITNFVNVINCSIINNIGGGLRDDDLNSVLMRNCIVLGNSNYNVQGPLSVDYSNIQGGWPGQGNIDTDPLFLSGPNGDYYLSNGSPCIDAGGDLAVDSCFPIAHENRCMDQYSIQIDSAADQGVVDMGYHYLLKNKILHVPDDFGTIQAAVDHAVSGDTVLVQDGRYAGSGNRDITMTGKAVSVMSVNGSAHCVIDCQGSPDDPHRGFSLTRRPPANALISGFTIRNGFADEGGGMYIEDASPNIVDCVLNANTSEFLGGAIAMRQARQPSQTSRFSETTPETQAAQCTLISHRRNL